jgi:glycerol-3-phosphate dehydrogenase (NAD(P)+)
VSGRVRAAVVGGGSFGRGLALACARVKAPDERVVLWSREPRPLPGVECTADLTQVAAASLVFVAVPSVHIEVVAHRLGEVLDGRHLLVHVSRGLIGDGLLPVTQVLRTLTPCRRVGALAGPMVAEALIDGQPGGGIVGSLFPEVAEAVRAAIGGPTLRIYDTDDAIGVQVASAFVGLIALALGYAKGIGMGPGTVAIMGARGMAEGARLGDSLGAREVTFAGLAGMGDLLAAVAGDGRPEVQFGLALAGGLPVADAARKAGAYVEGAALARQICRHAASHHLDVPMSSVLADLLEGQIDATAAIRRLMARPTRGE